jgi:hypothetical protein
MRDQLGNHCRSDARNKRAFDPKMFSTPGKSSTNGGASAAVEHPLKTPQRASSTIDNHLRENFSSAELPFQPVPRLHSKTSFTTSSNVTLRRLPKQSGIVTDVHRDT